MNASATAPLVIATVDPLTDPLWLGLVQKERAGLFHSPAWLRALGDTYGFSVRASIALDASGEPTAGIAYCELDDLAGNRIVSLPFSDNCDPLFVSLDAWRALLAQLQLQRIPVHLRCLFEHRVCASGTSLSIEKRARWHRLSVRGLRAKSGTPLHLPRAERFVLPNGPESKSGRCPVRPTARRSIGCTSPFEKGSIACSRNRSGFLKRSNIISRKLALGIRSPHSSTGE